MFTLTPTQLHYIITYGIIQPLNNTNTMRDIVTHVTFNYTILTRINNECVCVWYTTCSRYNNNKILKTHENTIYI